MLNVVAVVDDDPVVLDAVDQMLRSVGYITELFTSGEAYLANIGTSAATCLVSDLNLDGISGIELRRQLVADGVPIPTILMSGDGNHAIESAAIDSGCVAFLQKPFPIGLLLAAVEAACGLESRDAARKLGRATSDTPDRKTSSAFPARCA